MHVEQSVVYNRTTHSRELLGMGLDRWKKVFYWGAAIWLSGTIAMQIAKRTSPSYTLGNVGTIFALFELATFVLGIVLLCRWAWLKLQGGQNSRSAFPQNPGRPPRGKISNPSSDSTARWEALVRYDEEIRAAAEKLSPFGAEWVNRLGDAFFTLNEDRIYLANIVERLRSEARSEAERRWKQRFSRTAQDESVTQDSLAILSEAEEKGYEVRVAISGVVIVTKGTLNLRLYSNSDIKRFDQNTLSTDDGIRGRHPSRPSGAAIHEAGDHAATPRRGT
jgi:hypothetical protein